MSDEDLPPAPTGPAPAPVPLDGLTEIRIHGVGGTPPEAMLGTLQPQLVAGDRVAGFYRTTDARGRHREAYSWGGLTSRSRLRVLWLLLLPSMLANMAGWTARRRARSAAEEEAIAPATRAFRWSARVAALALTTLTMFLVVYLCLDVVAYQCGGDLVCAGRGPWPDLVEDTGLVDHPGRRLVGGALLALAVLGVFVLLAVRSRAAYDSVEPPVEEPDAEARAAGTADEPVRSVRCEAALPGGLRHPDFWSGRQWHIHLSRLHVATCLAGLGLILGLYVQELSDGSTAAGGIALAAIVGAAAVIVAVVVALVSDTALLRVATGLVGAGWLFLVGAAVAAWSLPAAATPKGPLPGSVEVLYLGMMLWGAFWVPMIVQQVTAWLRRQHDPQWWSPRTWWRRWRGHGPPHVPYFPWATPFVLNALALMLATAGLLSLIALVATALGPVTWELRPEEDDAGVLGAIYVLPAIGAIASLLTLGLLAVTIAFAIGIGVTLLVHRGARRASTTEQSLRAAYGLPPEAVPPAEPPARSEAAWWRSALDPPPATTGRGDADDARPTAWVRSVSGMRFLATATTRAWILFVSLVVVGLAWLVVILFTALVQDRGVPEVALPLGIALAVAIPPLVMALLALTWRDEGKRRILGVLFDIGTFFPRSFHPFAPPAYAGRAVPELIRRIWRLHDNGGRVVLAAHSQGSVVAAAAVARTSARRNKEPRLGLLTFGSPLGKLYRWAFPALFSDQLLAGMSDGVAGIGPVLWRNVYYRTDYIGGPVRVPASTVPEGIDDKLTDPATHRYVFDQPLPPVLTHTGYAVDARLWGRVDVMCDEILEILPAPASTAPPADRAPAPGEVDGAVLSEEPDTVAP